MCQFKKTPNIALKTKTLCIHHIQWHHYLISMHWFFPLFTLSLEHEPTVTATQCIILPCNATQPYNNLSFAMSSTTNEKNLGLNVSKTQPNQLQYSTKQISNSQSWSKFPRPSLWLSLFENGCTNISNLCTTPIATCPSCQVQLLGQSTHAQAHCILLPLAHCSSLTSFPPSCCRKFTRQALFLLL